MYFKGYTKQYSNYDKDLINNFLDLNIDVLLYQNNSNIYYSVFDETYNSNNGLELSLDDDPIQVIKITNYNLQTIINLFNNSIIKYILINKVDKTYYISIFVSEIHKNKYIPLPDLEMMKEDVFEDKQIK